MVFKALQLQEQYLEQNVALYMTFFTSQKNCGIQCLVTAIGLFCLFSFLQRTGNLLIKYQLL